MDGELEDSAAESLFKTLSNEAELRRTWDAFHLIGDALRRAPELSPDFSRRVMDCLADEPTVLAPFSAQRQPRATRFFVPLAASIMGIGAVAWVAQSLNQPEPAPVALSTPAAVVSIPSPVLASQQAQAETVLPVALPWPAPQVQEYLVAHQGYSPRANIQGVAHYVRSVSNTDRDPRR